MPLFICPTLNTQHKPVQLTAVADCIYDQTCVLLRESASEILKTNFLSMYLQKLLQNDVCQSDSFEWSWGYLVFMQHHITGICHMNINDDANMVDAPRLSIRVPVHATWQMQRCKNDISKHQSLGSSARIQKRCRVATKKSTATVISNICVPGNFIDRKAFACWWTTVVPPTISPLSLYLTPSSNASP